MTYHPPTELNEWIEYEGDEFRRERDAARRAAAHAPTQREVEDALAERFEAAKAEIEEETK